MDRAIGVFCAMFVGVLAMAIIVAMGFEVLPGWLLWVLCSAAAALMLTAVVAIDGIAWEAKSCALRCADCASFFVAPWRPGA